MGNKKAIKNNRDTSVNLLFIGYELVMWFFVCAKIDVPFLEQYDVV